MRVALQSYASGELGMAEVAAPVAKSGNVVVQTQVSLVSAGTEKAIIDVAKKSMLGKALARPDWVKQVIDKVKTEGLLEAWRQSQARLDTPLPLGYSSAGVVVDVGAGVTDFSVGDRVACSGSGYASHAEVVSVPRNLCVKLPSPSQGEGPGEEASFEEASFVALGGIALEAVRMAQPELGHRVVSIGLGLLGQLTASSYVIYAALSLFGAKLSVGNSMWQALGLWLKSCLPISYVLLSAVLVSRWDLQVIAVSH